MQTLQSKIIGQALTGSISQNEAALQAIGLKDVEVQCSTHGPSTIQLLKTFDIFKNEPPRCAKCVAEEKRARDEEHQRAYQEYLVKQEKDEIEQLIGRCGIPLRFRNCDLETYKPVNAKAAKILSSCRDYVGTFDEARRVGRSVVMCGNAGTGKTHLAIGIAVEVMRKTKRSVTFTTIAKALRSVKDTYARGSARSENEAIKQFVYPDLLILDEVGLQFGSDTEKNILFEIINERYEGVRPTILISNLAMLGITAFVGERVIDRMKDKGGKLMVFDWASHRGSDSGASQSKKDGL